MLFFPGDADCSIAHNSVHTSARMDYMDDFTLHTTAPTKRILPIAARAAATLTAALAKRR